MPLTAYVIENKFWSNDSWKQPNARPTRFKKEKIFKIRPFIIDGTGGIAVLRGIWNWVKYKGVYYHAIRTKTWVLNPENEDDSVFEYALVRDMWVNMLDKVVEVKGNLATWNRDELLIHHINKCAPILQTPAELIRLNCISKKAEWNYEVQIVPIEKELEMQVLPYDAFKRFNDSLKSKNVRAYKEALKHIFKNRKDVYIFDFLPSVNDPNNWKNILIKRIDEDLKQIRNDERRIIIKVTAGSLEKLKSNYAISHSDGVVGTPEPQYYPEKIDLSELTDIKPLDPKTLKDRPNSESFTKENFTFHVSVPEFSRKNKGLVLKIRRKAYLPGRHWYQPLGTREPKNRKAWWPEIDPGQTGWCQQEIEFRGGWNNAYLYYIDRQDFVFSFRNWTGQWISDIERRWLKDIKVAPNGFKALVPILGYYKKGQARTITSYTTRQPTRPTTPEYEGHYGVSWLWWVMKDKIPSYGFLMFQIHKTYEDWDRFEYLGDKPLEKIEYYSGIHRNFLAEEIDRDTSSWWHIAGENHGSGSLCGNNSTISKLFLYLFHLRFLYFVPHTQTLKGAYNYPAFGDWSDDAYQVRGFLTEVERDNSDNLYVNRLVTADLNGLINPYKSLQNYRDWLTQEKNEKDFWNRGIIKKSFDLDGITVKKGDYFFSSLDYEVTKYGENPWPEDGGKALSYIENGWINKTWNLLEDIAVPNDWNPWLLQPEYKDRKLIALCSNLSGNLELREITVLREELSLSEEYENAVKSVRINEGERKTTDSQTFYHFKKLGISTERLEQENSKEYYELFAQYYRSLGYNVDAFRTGDTFIGQWNCVSKDEAKGKKSGWFLYDLVGTQWYLLQVNDKFHYIAKEGVTILKRVTEPEDKFFKQEVSEKTKNLSVLEKINQICCVRYKTLRLPIKYRFSFHPDEENEIFIKAKPIETGKKISLFQNAIFYLKTKFDVIESVVSSSKPSPEMQQNLPDVTTLQQLNLSILRAQEDRQVQGEYLDFRKKMVDIQTQRGLWDIKYDTIVRGLSVAADISGLSAGVGRWGANRKIAQINKAASLWTKTQREQILETQVYPTYGEYLDEYRKLNSHKRAAPWARKMKKDQLGWQRMDRNRKALGVYEDYVDDGFGIVSDIMRLAVLNPERARRIKEDQELNYKKLALQSFEYDLTEFRNKQDAELKINAISHSYSQTQVTDENLDAQLRKEKGIEELSIECYVPSSEQLKYMRAYKEEYGIDCDIPNQTVILKEGMPQNVIRFSFLDDKHIKGIEDDFEKQWLISRLLAGVKIVEVEPATQGYNYYGRDYHIPIAVDIQPYLDKQTELRQELDEEKEKVTIEKQKVEALVAKAEANKAKVDAADKTIKDLEAANRRADTLHDSLQKREQELQTEKNEKQLYLEQKIKLAEQKKEVEEKAKNLETTLRNKEEEKEKLQKEKQALQEKIAKKDKQIAELSKRPDAGGEDIAALKEQLKAAVTTFNNYQRTIVLKNREDCEEIKADFAKEISYLRDSNLFGTDKDHAIGYVNYAENINDSYKEYGYYGDIANSKYYESNVDFKDAQFLIQALVEHRSTLRYTQINNLVDKAVRWEISDTRTPSNIDDSNKNFGIYTPKVWSRRIARHLETLQNKICPENLEQAAENDPNIKTVQYMEQELNKIKSLTYKSIVQNKRDVDDDPTHWKKDYFDAQVEKWNKKADPWVAFEKEFLTKGAAFGLDDNEFDQKGWFLYFLYDMQRLLGWNKFMPGDNGYILPFFYDSFYWWTDFLKNEECVNRDTNRQTLFDEDGDKRVKVLQKLIRNKIFTLISEIIEERTKSINQKNADFYDHRVLRKRRKLNRDYYPSTTTWKYITIENWKNLFYHNTFIRDAINRGYDSNSGYDSTNISDLIKTIDENYENLKYRIKENYITEYVIADQTGRFEARWPKGKWHQTLDSNGLWEAAKWDWERWKDPTTDQTTSGNRTKVKLFRYTGEPNVPSLSLITTLILFMMNIDGNQVMSPWIIWKWKDSSNDYYPETQSNDKAWSFLSSGGKIRWNNFVYVLTRLLGDIRYKKEGEIIPEVITEKVIREKLMQVTEPHLFAQWADPIINSKILI